MKRFCVAALVAFAAACASSPGGEPETMPAPQPAADSRVSELQTQLTELLERIDVLNQRISQLEETNAATNVGRASANPVRVEARPAPAEESRVEARPASFETQPPQRALVGAQIAEDYRQAIMLFGRGRHAEARSTFESVYEADPSGDLADNALFWMGEIYFAAKDYSNAVRFYQRVVTDYSTQNKAPDALFKIAMAQERTGDLALARRTLEQVIQRYPYSSPASSAKAELERIKY
jgi:tol-pal system protein YbgF